MDRFLVMEAMYNMEVSALFINYEHGVLIGKIK